MRGPLLPPPPGGIGIRSGVGVLSIGIGLGVARGACGSRFCIVSYGEAQVGWSAIDEVIPENPYWQLNDGSPNILTHWRGSERLI